MYIGKEHWLGLDNIYKLTNRKNVKTQLKIILEYASGQNHIVTYNDFHLKDQVESTFTHMMMNFLIPFWFQTTYRLHLGHKSGDNIGNFRYSNNMAFTTFDHDQDNYSENCAIHNGGKGFDYWAPVLWMTSALFIWDKSATVAFLHFTGFKLLLKCQQGLAGVSWTSKEPAQTKDLCLITNLCANIPPKLDRSQKNVFVNLIQFWLNIYTLNQVFRSFLKSLF